MQSIRTVDFEKYMMEKHFASISFSRAHRVPLNILQQILSYSNYNTMLVEYVVSILTKSFYIGRVVKVVPNSLKSGIVSKGARSRKSLDFIVDVGDDMPKTRVKCICREDGNIDIYIMCCICTTNVISSKPKKLFMSTSSYICRGRGCREDYLIFCCYCAKYVTTVDTIYNKPRDICENCNNKYYNNPQHIQWEKEFEEENQRLKEQEEDERKYAFYDPYNPYDEDDF